MAANKFCSIRHPVASILNVRKTTLFLNDHERG